MYQDRPMICHNCYTYGPTKARCRRKGVCRNCGEDDRMSDKTNKCSNESKRANCGEATCTGSNEYEIKKKERII